MNLTDYNEIRSLLARHGFRFSKSLGQNFLTAAWVPERIAEEAGLDETVGVLEVGPGIARTWKFSSAMCSSRTCPRWRGSAFPD